MPDHQAVTQTVVASQAQQISLSPVLHNQAPCNLMGHGFVLTQRWKQRKTWKGDNAMADAMAFGMCLVDRTRQGKKYATPRTSQMVRGCLVGVLQRHLSKYQALAGQNQVNSTTAARLALDENSGLDSPIPIDIMTARLGLRYLWEAFQSHQHRPAYDANITIIGTSLDLLPAHPPRHIAIIMTEDGRCTLLTQGVIVRQACEGLVKLLPQKQLSHREAHALLHPTRAQPPPPPPRLGKKTTFFESGTAPRLQPRPESPTIVGRAPPSPAAGPPPAPPHHLPPTPPQRPRPPCPTQSPG
jgi:hypothetical protein